MKRLINLAKAENGHQDWAQLTLTQSADPLAIGNFFGSIDPTRLGYNAITDLDRAVNVIDALGRTAVLQQADYRLAVAVKHGNACGAVFGDIADGLRLLNQNLVDGDSLAIFGGGVVTNYRMDQRFAKTLLHHSNDSGKPRKFSFVAAPSYTPGALSALGDRFFVLTNPALAEPPAPPVPRVMRRDVRGGYLEQPASTYVFNHLHDEVEVTGELTDSILRDMRLGWAIGAHSNSNTIALVKGGMLIGLAVGQPSRVGAVELAIKRAQAAGHSVKGAVVYSDSFFSHLDAPQALIQAEVSAVFATRGSLADEKVRALFGGYGVTFLTLPDNTARGFFGH